MEKQEILNIVSKILNIKFESKLFNNPLEKKKSQEDLDVQIKIITDYIYNETLKIDYITLDYIKGIHKLLYSKGTIIKTIRDGNIYNNKVGEWRLNEARHPDDNHLHSLQLNIETDLINYTNNYNFIENKKRVDILRYYFDFLRVHPFADSNLTVISLICELELFKYGFRSLNLLETRFKDGKFNHFFLYEYENNKTKTGILQEIEKMIDDFYSGKLSKDIIEKKEKIILKSSQELSVGNINKNDLYQKQLDQFIQDNFLNISKELIDYESRKIVYNNTLHYLRNAFFRTAQDKHQLVLNGYVADTNRLIKYVEENFIYKDAGNLEIDFIKGLHKNLFPEGFIAKNKDTNGREFIQMIPGEFRKINLISKTNPNQNIYSKW